MTAIRLDQNFLHAPACRITVTSGGVTVLFEGREEVAIAWNLLDDPAVLVEAFGTLQVRVFVQLVPVLGMIYQRRAAYMEILQ